MLEAFDTRQEKAAATLGANGWQTFWRVTFPALRWGLIYGVTLTFARALGEFGAVLVIGGGVQGRTETATLFIYRALEERQYIGAYSAALALGLFSLILVLGSDWLEEKDIDNFHAISGKPLQIIERKDKTGGSHAPNLFWYLHCAWYVHFLIFLEHPC